MVAQVLLLIYLTIILRINVQYMLNQSHMSQKHLMIAISRVSGLVFKILQGLMDSVTKDGYVVRYTQIFATSFLDICTLIYIYIRVRWNISHRVGK